MVTMVMSSVHVPVMVDEVVAGLQVQRAGKFVDCTVGLGGHAAAILRHIFPDGDLLGLDVDCEAVSIARSNLSMYRDKVTVVNDNFNNLEDICHRLNFYPVDGILFDLGLSSMQLDVSQRGFSFRRDAPLDMRFDTSQDLNAANIVNTCSEEELAHIFREYGEERYSKRIARCIVEARPITNTLELAHIAERVAGRRRGRIHPATRIFMALRIVVNSELENLRLALEQAVKLLHFRGRLVVISYHSLEDRIVKEFMRCASSGRVSSPSLKLITKKIIRPSEEERETNPRSRSAKMRVAERLE